MNWVATLILPRGYWNYRSTINIKIKINIIVEFFLLHKIKLAQHYNVAEKSHFTRDVRLLF